MSRKNVSWSVLLVLICWASLVAPASAQHFQQVKGTLPMSPLAGTRSLASMSMPMSGDTIPARIPSAK
jgi:hypothetical protein